MDKKYYQLPKAVLPLLKGEEIRTYLKMYDQWRMMMDANGYYYRSISQLAKDCGCSERTIAYHIKRFEELGLLSHNKGNSFKKANEFKFNTTDTTATDCRSENEADRTTAMKCKDTTATDCTGTTEIDCKPTNNKETKNKETKYNTMIHRNHDIKTKKENIKEKKDEAVMTPENFRKNIEGMVQRFQSSVPYYKTDSKGSSVLNNVYWKYREKYKEMLEYTFKFSTTDQGCLNVAEDLFPKMKDAYEKACDKFHEYTVKKKDETLNCCHIDFPSYQEAYNAYLTYLKKQSQAPSVIEP